MEWKYKIAGVGNTSKLYSCTQYMFKKKQKKQKKVKNI